MFGHDDGVDEHTCLQLYLIEGGEDTVFVTVGHGWLINEYQQVNI
jgi:hypothetical protein